MSSMDPNATADEAINYNKVLSQISANLQNALSTFGSASTQYQTILNMLHDCLRRIDSDRSQNFPPIDPDTLSVAMGFLNIK
ncbi:hypothetical protein FE257_011705 [Aspergillus nanangensis]|uniref:Uncharacterized protein n=1 Tax=Aspergillus nanangensis TaxID=2582783 RepID=A0AAD4GY10_ASPNN|nr:hypothetical protein FE257_011705 [Aspergillus nanangensis]